MVVAHSLKAGVGLLLCQKTVKQTEYPKKARQEQRAFLLSGKQGRDETKTPQTDLAMVNTGLTTACFYSPNKDFAMCYFCFCRQQAQLNTGVHHD
ncbi:hypothetical protein ACFOSS_13815 [Pseudaeromonas sharmana]|uniref:Uncharacterized protein n=1 Tax=Pseudaeromonas sharmana TaxID=328412 RepID=A0ABV8CRB1_9GAMM